MADGTLSLVAADEVFGIIELGAHILGFVENLADVRNAALASKRLHRAAQFHLWRAIKLPNQCLRPRDPTDSFWQRFSALLEHHTLSLTLDMSVVEPALLQRIMARQWETPVQVPECFMIKVDLNNMFYGLERTLQQARRLRAFAARDVPRILDLLRILQAYHPNLQSISIAASSRDTFGLRPLPAIDIHHWNYELQGNPNLIVPLANSVNLGQSQLWWDPFSLLTFPNLRVLSLTNLQYDRQHFSPLFDALVVILKGAPNLADLELSLRHKIGGITLGGYFLEDMYGQPDRHNHALQTLCLQYAHAGGQPLHLETLRLGYGFEIFDEVTYSFLPQPWHPHYLSLLTDLRDLTQLHVEKPNHKDGTRLLAMSDDFGFELATSFRFKDTRGMPNLTKLTFPWSQGHLISQLQLANSARLAEIILRVDDPSPADWADASQPGGHPIWVKRYFNPRLWANLKLKGLILPTEHMCPEAADRFLAFVPYLKPMHALKIRMPSLTGGAANSSSGRMRTFRRRMERMTELRQLWLADGLGNWMGPNPDNSPRVDDPYPTEAQFLRFAGTLAYKCPKLEYLRILDRAWTITRLGEGAEPVLRELSPERVETELPWAFDWSKPKVF